MHINERIKRHLTFVHSFRRHFLFNFSLLGNFPEQLFLRATAAATFCTQNKVEWPAAFCTSINGVGVGLMFRLNLGANDELHEDLKSSFWNVTAI